MRVSERMKKWISMALCLCMLVQNCPVVAFAAEDNLCTHHPEHTAECHYAQGSAGAPCTHVHDAECGYREAVAEVKCACEATDENGALVHTEGCGYVAPVAGADCAHVHDDSCGYVAAVEAHECHYECAECANNELSSRTSPQTGVAIPEGDAQNQEIATSAPDGDLLAMTEAVCDCGTDDPAVHATTCDAYVAPENPQCFCAEACGVESQNIWCDVCGFDYTACLGRDTAAAYVTMTGGEKLYLKPNANWLVDNARFAIYVFGTGNAWASMTDSDSDGIYEVEVPAGSWTNVIFCRMNPSAAANSWDNKWNQTGDLTYDGTNDLFTIPDGSWDGTTTGWSKMPVPVPDPVCTCETKCAEGSVNRECAVCSAEGADLTGCIGEACEHTYNTAGTCTVCGEQAAAKIGETYYLTLAQAAAKVTEGGTIQVLTDVTIGEDETVTFANFATLDVAEGKTVTCNGSVKIGEEDGIIFENTLYYYGGDVTNSGYHGPSIDVSKVSDITYWKAGSGYMILTPASGEETAVLELHNANVTHSPGSVEEGVIDHNDSLTVRFYGDNMISSGDRIDAHMAVLRTDGTLTLMGMEPDATLSLISGGRVGIEVEALEVKSGTVSITTGGGGFTMAVRRATSVTVDAGAVLNLTVGEVEGSCGVGASITGDTIHGTLNGLIAVPAENDSGMAVIASGDALLIANFTIPAHMPVPFAVPEGTSLTVNAGVTLDLSVLTADDIDFTGTIINNGTILLPEGFDIPDTLTGGTVTIGDKTYLWSSENEKWICAEGSHVTELEENKATCAKAAICDLCGASYGELNLTNHDENAEYENGFCLNCDAYQPAELVGTSYQITNAGQLYWFAQQVNSGSTAINGELTADIKVNENVLTADGALNGDGSNFRAWTPIGNNSNRYTGEFHGNEHTVSGLYFNGSADYVGLFGYVGNDDTVQVGSDGNVLVGSGGTVQNVGVIDSYLDGGSYVGGVVGYNDISGTVQYVYNTGNIQGSSQYVGGVVGRNQYIVRYAYNTGTVFANNYAGGVVGHNNYILEYAYNTGSASDWYNYYVGVTGYNRDSTKLKNCYYLADSETDSFDGTTAKTAGQFEIGEVAYLLGSPFGQNIGTHVSPVLNLGYTVYEVRNCKNETIYSNTNANTGHIGGTATCIEKAVCTVCGASYGAVGEHSTTAEGDIAADCNSKAYCSVCDSEYGEVDTTNHDSSVDFNDNGFCPNGCYEPATDSDSDGYYEIDNAGKLYWFAAQVNSGNTAINGKLTQNIVVNEGTLTAETTDARAWTPIGQSPYLYNGTFNGGEFTVSGLYCGDSSAYYASLFGAVDDEGIVENVGVIDSYLNGTAYAGGVVGQNWGTVASCYNTGTVCGSGCVGGVVSRNAGTVTNCRNTGNVTGINSSIGGVVGCSDDGTVASCYNTGAVSGDYYVGGVVGSSDISSVKNCYNTGNVTGTDSVGGVVGSSNNCTVENCYNIGFVSGIANYIGGVIGINKSTVTNCYYLSGYAVDGNNTVQFGIGNPYLGGTTADIAGQTAGKFSAQFASGEVAYLLQGQQTEQVWGQVIGIEDHPVLGGKKVYCGYTSCGDTAEKYTNDETVSAEKPAHSTGAVGDKAATCTAPAYCSVCDSEYGEVDKTNHDTENAEYDNGFCPNCDAYEPAELVNGVYQISNAGNLYWFADKVTNENAAYSSADAILTCDIRVNEGTMTEASTGARVWTPIGKVGWIDNKRVEYPYTGTFEGNGKTVSGLYFNDTSANFSVGLFSLVGEGGTVRNVGIADSYLCGSQSIGAVAGTNYGTVTGCYNTGTVIGSSNSVGGVAGSNSGTLTDCHNTGTVSGESSVGGVAGSNRGTLTDCHNTGTVSGESDVGGVVGSSIGSYTYGSGLIMCNAIVTDCYNTGAVSGKNNVGGVVGYNAAYYSSSSGIVFSTAIVTDCHNTGTVSGKNDIGGVVGAHSGTVMGCYNTGTVSSESSVGGVVAYNNGIVMDCYHSGSISGTTYVGGVVGNNIVNNTSTGTVTNCYFDSTVYTGNAIGTNEGTATNVEGKSTEQFASGEVAYLLSQGENGSIWGQDLDNGKTKQTTPTFTGAKVYCGYTSCGDTAAVYTNNANVFPEKPEHTQNPTYTDNHNGTHSAVYPCCGTKGQPEGHTLTYTANGNIITASCSANCGYGGTATISATGKTYDGNAVEVVVSKTGSLENTDIPVTLTKDGEAFTGEPVNAGTYTASVTLGDKTVSVDFTIAKADAIIALAPTPNSGLTYTGEAQYLISPGSAEGGILVYSLSEDGELYESIPQGTDAGEYRVWYFVQGDENHNDSAKDSVPVTIEKATVTVTADAKTKTYGDADPELTYTASGLFGEDKLTGALTRAEGENVGSYAITQGTLTAGDNYTISFTGAEFAIGVKDVDVMTMEVEVTLEQDSYAYDGTAKEPEVTSIIVDGVKLTEDVDYRVLSYERNIYVGEAEVVIHFIGNYRGSLSRFFQITKAPLTVTADSKTMITGQELPTFTYTITGFVNGETEDVLTTKPTVSCEADGKTAGTYGITVSGAAADNYEITHVNGTLTVADHQHAWTYTAEGDTITAICGNGSTCPEAEQTITICAEGKIYDGKPVTAELDGSIEGVDDPEITYSGNTDAGTHTASITIEGKTASVKFTIEKATVTVTADAKSKPYGTDNPALTYTSEGLLGDDALTGALETTATKTSSVGEYDITVGSLANSNYTIDFVGAKLTITKAAAPEIQWPTAAALTYGQKLSDSALTSEDKNGTFAWQDGSIVPTVKNNGYVVVYTPKDTDNYDYTVVELTETIPVTVSKGQATVTAAPTPNTLAYTGEAQYLISAGEANGGTMQYSTDNQTWSTTIPQGTDAGEYTVYYKVVGDANHSDTAVDSIEVTIAKADPVIGTVGCKMPLFDSTDISTVELTRTDMSVDGTLILTDAKLTAGEGTYNWKFTPEDTDNYNAITGTVVLTVTADVLEQIKATGTLEKFSYVYGEPFSIDGMTITASYTSGTTKDVTGLVSFDSTLAVGQTAVELTYQGKICVIDGITVARKQLDVSGMSWTVPTNAVYSGTAYTATLNGTLPEGVIVTKTGDTATNAGSYTAKAVFSLAEGYSADNYEIVNGEDLTAEWSIDKAALTITADSYESVRYGSAAPAFAANYSGFVNGETEAVLGGELVFSCEYDTANAAKRKPGDYPIVPSGLTSNNYEISYVDGNLEVILANLVIVIDDKTVTYGDAAPEYTYHYEGFVYGEDISVMDKPGTVVCGYKPGDPVGTMEILSDNYGEDDCYHVVNQRRATLTIEKLAVAEPTVTGTYTYTGSEQTVTLAGVESCMTVASGNKATNAGSYEVVITLDNNHKWADGSDGKVRWSIAKAEPKAEDFVFQAPGNLTYNGEAKSASVSVKTGIEGMGKIIAVMYYNADSSPAVEKQPISAGNYFVQINVDAGENYTEKSFFRGEDWVFSIGKAKAEITVDTTPITVTYGETVTLPTATANFGTVSCDKTANDLVNVGTYTVTYTVDDTANFDGDTKTVTVTVNPKAITEADVKLNGSLTYTGEEQTQPITVAAGITYTVTGDKATNVGTYQLTVKGTGNYTGEVKLSWSIKKAAAVVTKAPAAKTLTYIGEAQELITAGEAEGGTMQYQLNGGAWSASIPAATDEGSYTVSYKVLGDANHTDTDPVTLTVTIGDCTHSGNTNQDDADCTTEVTCSVCGDVLVESKTHVWGDWTTTLEPTTTTEGSKERLCTNDGCEAKDTDSIPMLNEVEVPEEIVGGDVSVDNPTPATGDDVTITVTPDTGKEVDEVIVTGKDGKEIPVTDNGDGTYTYEQPDGNVTVEVIIKDTIYTVTWIVDGTTYKTTQYKYGETITAPTDPDKAQSGCTTYTFDKWNGFTSGMTMPDNESLTFTAVFTEGESHIDENTDHICDRNCGKTDMGDHVDRNLDHVCDYGCDVAIGEHKDANKDHACDYGCTESIGTCEDADKDHDCDYGCDKVYGKHEDNNADHICDYGCKVTIGTHEDTNKDHICDYGCSEAIGTCEDADKDHDCDYGCDKVYGTHEDTDKDHACDYGCTEAIGTCEDADKDHDCDYGCDKVYGTHEDTDKNHVCDYGCKVAIGTCEDTNKDHDCDYGCDKVYGEHTDSNKDHICDYGCSESIGNCEDADKDHDCDYGCDKVYGTHEDTDKDHACDYGCSETIGTCEDADKDHDCDYGCDKVYGEHKDTVGDGDHVCDYGCGETLTDCADVDTDTDHKCDECGAAMPKDGTQVEIPSDDTGTITPGAPAEIDGKPIVIDWDGEIWLEDSGSRLMVTYTFNEDEDPHKEYPTAMYVWYLNWTDENGDGTEDHCEAIRIPELDNFMTYKGTSIRINHSSDGIRFFTAVPVDTLNQVMKGTLLTGELEGYKLVEMGTLYKWAATGTELTVANGAKSYVYGGSAGSTYRQFSKEGSLSWFTGMLTDLPGDAATLAKDILSRPYAVFENADGDQIKLYSGSVQRSIYYVALQNKDTWASGTAYDNYVEKIISTVEAAKG